MYKSQDLTKFLDTIDSRYRGRATAVEVSAEVWTDGKGHQALMVTVVEAGEILEEDDFYYPEHEDMLEDEKSVNRNYSNG